MGTSQPAKPYVSNLSHTARQIIDSRASKVLDPYDYCRQASFRLMDDLLMGGFQASMLRCKGLLTEAGEADQRWLNLGPQGHWVHFLVQVDNEVVDLTREQFFPKSGSPYIQSLAACKAEWGSVAIMTE